MLGQHQMREDCAVFVLHKGSFHLFVRNLSEHAAASDMKLEDTISRTSQ